MENNNNEPTTSPDLEAQLKRALADYANLQKRFDKEKEDVAKFANEILLMQLISIVDGLEMTLKQFNSLLENAGFTKKYVNAGDHFDAGFMEAVESDGEGKTVTEAYTPAYFLHDKMIRPAKVKVGKEKHHG